MCNARTCVIDTRRTEEDLTTAPCGFQAEPSSTHCRTILNSCHSASLLPSTPFHLPASTKDTGVLVQIADLSPVLVVLFDSITPVPTQSTAAHSP